MASRHTNSRKTRKSGGKAQKTPTKKELFAFLKKAGKPASAHATKEQLIRKAAAVKSAATKERKRVSHEKRSLAARQGWQTRKQKSPDLRKWEQERRKTQQAQLKLIDEAAKYTKWPGDFIRFGDLVYFPTTDLPLNAIHTFLAALKQRGVPVFRVEREVPVGEYRRTTENQVTRAGYISTNWIFFSTISNEELLVGNRFRHWPSLKSMRVPGIDLMRWIVIRQQDINYLPQAMRVALRNAPIETRERKSEDETTFYLTHKRKPTKRELAKLRRAREKAEEEYEEDFEEDEDEE